jgi:hypothetical protein
MLERTSYLVRERPRGLRLLDAYDILDPRSKTQVGTALQASRGWLDIPCALLGDRLLSTTVIVYQGDDKDADREEVFAIRRRLVFPGPGVEVASPQGELVGRFVARGLLPSSTWQVVDDHGQVIAVLKGRWWSRQCELFGPAGEKLGQVERAQSGLLSMTTTYAANLLGPPNPRLAMLLLAAPLALELIAGSPG